MKPTGNRLLTFPFIGGGMHAQTVTRAPIAPHIKEDKHESVEVCSSAGCDPSSGSDWFFNVLCQLSSPTKCISQRPGLAAVTGQRREHREEAVLVQRPTKPRRHGQRKCRASQSGLH